MEPGADGMGDNTPPAAFPAAVRPCLPPATGTDAAASGFATSLVIHAALILALAIAMPSPGPTSIGDEAMSVEIVLAEEAIDIPALPQPDDPLVTIAEAIPTAAAQTSAAERMETPPDIPPPDPAPPDIAPLLQPLPGPEPARMEEPATAPAPTTGTPPPSLTQEQSRAGINDAYGARIARHLARFKRFPANIRQRLAQGRVVIAFDLSPQGRVIRVAVAESSGIPAFDREAEAMVRRAEPFPAPGGPSAAPLSFSVPVAYRLRE